jgi:adenine-specific DNA-methyltransferase
VRVSGPFTVEGMRSEELSLGEEGLFDGTPNEWQENDVADEVQNLRAYLSRMVGLIRQDGITFPDNKHQNFQRVEPLFEESTGTLIHAEALWRGMDEKEPNNIGITFGPQYGPVTAEQVADIIRGGRRYDELVIAGFSFDAAALDAIQENQHPKQKIHIAHIRPDVSPGMDGLLKDMPHSQLFTVFGQPEINVKETKDGEYTVELLGVDIYDPLTGEVRSSKAEKVAAWFLDSDYDGRCFCITQAFFPDQNAWEKIAKSLATQTDTEIFEAFNGTISIPFKAGKHKRIAVKVIDPRGNEVIAIARLDKEKK